MPVAHTQAMGLLFSAVWIDAGCRVVSTDAVQPATASSLLLLIMRILASTLLPHSSGNVADYACTIAAQGT